MLCVCCCRSCCASSVGAPEFDSPEWGTLWVDDSWGGSYLFVLQILIAMKVLAQTEGFRFVECGFLEINGKPDYRMQTQDSYTLRWRDSYLFDNADQMFTAIGDLEYCKWLTGQPAYRKYT